jgi:hypothetical protein
MILASILCAVCVFGALAQGPRPTPRLNALLWALAAFTALCAVRAAA